MNGECQILTHKCSYEMQNNAYLINFISILPFFFNQRFKAFKPFNPSTSLRMSGNTCRAW